MHGAGGMEIIVSEIITQQHEATLDTHTGAVYALLFLLERCSAPVVTVPSACGRFKLVPGFTSGRCG